MTDIAALASAQSELGHAINQLFENFKKERIDRRTKEGTLKYQTSLNEFIIKFNKRHQELECIQQVHPDHAYFTQAYHTQVQEVCKDFLCKIDQRLRECPADAPQSSAPATTPTDTNQVDSAKTLRMHAATIKALDRLINSIREEFNAPRSRAYYNQKLKSINDYWVQITCLHQEVIAELHDSTRAQEEYRSIEDKYQNLAIELQERLDEQSITCSNSMNVKLPKIALPNFDGTNTQWKPFMDLFTQLIHNQSISAAEKMYYLKAHLTGEPSRLIRHLQATEQNYAVAWKILTDRYNNSRSIVTALLNELLSQSTLTVESGTGIKRIHDVSKECLLSLQNMGVKIKEWNAILIHILLQKLDKESRKLYEQSLQRPREIQNVDDFFKFLESRFQMLEAMHTKDERKKPVTFVTSTARTQCPICKAEHKIYRCNKFLNSSLDNKFQLVKQFKLCPNCLKPGHQIQGCTSGNCTYCRGRHNSLLHNSCRDKQEAVKPNHTIRQNSTTLQSITPSKLIQQASNKATTSLKASAKSQVLLATAVVDIVNATGALVPCRILLDSASQLHFIRDSFVQLLGLKRHKISIPIIGIGGHETIAKHETKVALHSRANDFTTTLTAVVLPKISDYQPATYVCTSRWEIPANIQLADPDFYQPQAIDMLIGADLYYDLLQGGQIRVSNNLPLLQNTRLGWIVAGRTPNSSSISRFQCSIVTQPSVAALEKQLVKFWELDQHDAPSNRMTKEEYECEQHFQETFQRSPSGQLIVQLPFREPPHKLGSSIEMAIKRFYCLERKLDKNPELKRQYQAFMREYEHLGHMQIIHKELIPSENYYLPHHCVVKPESSSTKLRVVFDASAKTTTGKSLNDILKIGPTVQSDLFSILIRFRMHKYVMTADICKMYRQIQVDPEQRKYQLILWREHKDKPLQTYQLNTVTYGTASAPFLATRCLNQLALLEVDTSPQAAKVIRADTYVDDILTGTDSIDDTIKLREELVALLKSGNFELRKFCSNHPDILRTIPEEFREKLLLLQGDEVVKTLGMIWQPRDDVFQFKTTHHESDKTTKRTVLSDITRIFDPLGLIGPVTVLGKLFVQDLWKSNISWDEELPIQLKKRWQLFQCQLKELSCLKISRHVSFTDPVELQLHAFSDSSESAYGACCYIRTVDDFGQIRVQLLCSKSRLAPLKSTTLARLELCAAVLLAELVERIRQCLPKNLSKVYYYTDSTIVLSWIAAPSYTWSTFVANRVEKIQQLTTEHQWHHVEGTQNPADIISRGMLPARLHQSKLWFKGPDFLFEPASRWPNQKFQPLQEVPETRERKFAFSTRFKTENNTDIIASVNHKNSFTRLQRIFAYCIRFWENCRLPKERRSTGLLTITELDMAQNGLVRNVQRITFSKEFQNLKDNKSFDTNSSIQSLNPFLDEATNLIRVGGRLKHSQLNAESKHQMLLPRNHILSELLLNYLHRKHMHAAPQTLTAIARQRFWIIDIRTLARQIVHRCIRCFRCKPQSITQIMADLPARRVTPAQPFHTTGVDFCGPIVIHHKLRRAISDKAYIAVFVCFATKAVHLEIVSNLSSIAFINALKRFISRRGLCATIFCDNATNFVGAKSGLKELDDLFKSQELKESIHELCAQNRIDWKPIPPRSPHFGGLWEAAVKSAKKHLVRQTGNASLTHEELHTVITQIEAILNSRPLTPMSSDPNDLNALTPGHFLIGRPLTAFAEPDVSALNINSLTRFRRLHHIQQSFWKRWSLEYLQELQLRYKWKTKQHDLKKGTLVLLKDMNLPPLKWALGRIIDTFNGPDNHTRVVNVKTASGIFKRAIHNLCPLPIEEYYNNHHGEDSSSQQVTETITKGATCFLLQGASRTKPAATDDNTASPPAKRRNLSSGKKVNHPLKGRFLPINPRWSNWLTFSKQAKTTQPSITTEESKDIAQQTQVLSNPQRGNSMAVSFLLLTSLVLPIFGAPFNEPVEVAPFTDNPGLFFESIGQAQIINSEWNLLVYYNLTTYWTEFQGIRSCIAAIDHLCNATTIRKNHCLEILNQFEHQLRELEEASELLYKRSGGHKMVKRAPLNIIGNIASKLFGILDSEYAEYIEGEIEKTRKNENYLMQLLKNQTSVLESTTNIMKGREESIQQQFNSIKNHVEALHKYIGNAQYEQQSAQTFNSLSILTTLVLQNFHRIQGALLDVLTDLHHNKINPLLLSPMQLQEQIAQIKEHLPSMLTIPGHGKDGGLLLYSLMTAAARVTESYILFDIRIPLQQDEYFQLFKVIPIPTLHKGSFILIEPSTEYLIVNLPRDRYYPLMQFELDKCEILDDERYLCAQNHPIYNLKSSVSHCEMELLNHHQTLSPTCRFRTTKLSKIWIQLHTPNNWLFSLDAETTLNIVCGTEVLPKTLNGSGILRLRPECAVKQTSMTISGHGRYQSNLTSALIPRINISALIEDHLSLTQRTPQLASSEFHLQSNAREMKELTSRIKSLKAASSFPEEFNVHDVHHYTITYLSVTALLAIFSYLMYLRCKKTNTFQLPGASQEEQHQPIPKKRKGLDQKFVLDTNSRGEDV